jgi:hypothetical protein
MLSAVTEYRGDMIKCLQFLLTVVLATVLFTGCGGQDTSGDEEDAGGEEAASEAPSEAPIESLPSYDAGPDIDSETCQVQEALTDLGPEGTERLTDELMVQVSANEFANMQEAFASRGYTCGGLSG